MSFFRKKESKQPGIEEIREAVRKKYAEVSQSAVGNSLSPACPSAALLHFRKKACALFPPAVIQ
jgi:hypothetical protein